MRVYAAIPTMPSRLDVLEKAVESLRPQVDQVFVWLNGFINVPDFLYQSKVTPLMALPNRGSASRFFTPEVIARQDALIAYCDDDLIYPPDYISRLVSGWKKYGGVVTFHGRVLKKAEKLIGWSLPSFEAIHACLKTQVGDARVDICGTGVALCHANISPVAKDFVYPNYDDVEFSILMRNKGQILTCLEHEAGWLKYLEPKGPTIWEETSKIGHKSLIDLVNGARLWDSSLFHPQASPD